MANEERANGETGKNPAAAFASSAPMYTDAAFCLLLPLETLDYDAVVQGTDLIPVSVMEEWSKTEPTERKAAEEKLKGEWDHWMSAHSAMILSTDAGGKTKRVTSSGVSDTKNDIILYSIVEAESHEAAAKSFENHPHLQIPQSSIEVMEIRPMGGM
jgi:hypothetical protein